MPAHPAQPAGVMGQGDGKFGIVFLLERLFGATAACAVAVLLQQWKVQPLQ